MLVPDELYSKLVRNGAVIHMKNTCSPTPRDVKISTPDWAVEAAAAIGAEMTGRIEATGVRVIGDPGLLSAVPELVPRSVEEPRIAPEVAAQALYGALGRGGRGGGGRRRAPGAPDVVEGTRESAGHRCLKRLRRRWAAFPSLSAIPYSLWSYSQDLTGASEEGSLVSRQSPAGQGE
jgi:hypothetical protein